MSNCHLSSYDLLQSIERPHVFYFPCIHDLNKRKHEMTKIMTTCIGLLCKTANARDDFTAEDAGRI